MSNKLEFERGFLGMVIETKRLKIIVLTQEQLEMLVDNIPEFEKRLNCSYQGEKIEGIFKNILYEQSLKIEANSDVYLWLTFWLIVKKDDNIAVGMIDFKNIPNENREVEIGYGLGKKHEHFGYMTEAVEAFCTWGEKASKCKTYYCRNRNRQFFLSTCFAKKRFY